MGEAVLVPKAALATEDAIDLHSGVVLPRFALGQHRRVVPKGREKVDVIGHDDKIEKHIAIAVKVPQAVGNDLCQLGPAQHASAVTCIQLVVPTLGEFTMELPSQ